MTRSDMDHNHLWTADSLGADKSWVFPLSARGQDALRQAVRAAYVPGKPLFDYRREDFSSEIWFETLAAALAQAKRGRGLALVKGLPREDLTSNEFELMTWALGLHSGVPRPQGKATQYISTVRNEGNSNSYRSATGRGYSSNAELDFHTDSADLVYLSCYNKALSGGMSLVSSSMKAFEVMTAQRPDLAEYLLKPIGFSRQGEAAPREGPFVAQPVFSERDGKWFGRWNWNRVRSAQSMEGSPPISDTHRLALEVFDEIVRSPELSFQMWLEPGDLQILNSHVTLHSRTEFVDHEAPSDMRLLYRLWIAPPDSAALPPCWEDLYGCCIAGSVRGGIKGHCYGQAEAAFDKRQARTFGMNESICA